ncbi:hypothetical protein GCM10010407_10090 [Rarobacter incanus]
MLLAGAAIGPAILAPIMNSLIEKYGVTTALHALGIIFFVSIAACGWLIVTPPAGWVPRGWTPPAVTAGTAGAATEKTWKQMMATPLFWAMILLMACAATAGNMLVSSAKPIAVLQVGGGFGMEAAAFGAIIVSISTLANFAGRLSFGALYDKIGPNRSLLISLGATIVAMAAMSAASNAFFFTVCIVVLGFAFGGVLVIFPPMTSRNFGMKNLGINYGIMFIGYAIGGYIGPKLATAFVGPDPAATNYYRGAYIGAIVVGIVGIAIVALIMWLEKRQRAALTATATA